MSTEVYCTVQLPAIYLKPIAYYDHPPEYYETPKYKRRIAALRARRKWRTTFK